MKKSLLKFFDTYIDKKVVLTSYIFIQMLLHFLAFKVLNRREYNIIEYLTVFSSLVHSFIVYVVLLLNDKSKLMIYYYSISATMLNFFLIIDIGYLKYSDIRYLYAQSIVMFIILDITLKISTQNISRKLFYKYIVVALWTVGIMFGIFKIEIYMLVYQITFIIIITYPSMFLVLNYKKLRNYGRHLLPIISLFAIVNIIYFILTFVIFQEYSGMHNYDLYIYLNLIEMFLSYLVLSAIGFWKLVKNKKSTINRSIIINCIFIIGYLYCIKDNKENLKLIIFSLLSFFTILKQSQLLNHYIKLKDNRINHKQNGLVSPSIFKEILETSISDFRKEEIYKEQVADFLHDEILQDAIYIKKELRDNYEISINDKIFEIVDNMINTTRGQISLHRPYINYNISLVENYYNLIQSLKKRFGNDNILVDFICDDKLFLSSPYDLVIYRMIHELITNIFKHSKGYFSSIELKIQDKIISLTVTNYGDYLSNENSNNTDSRGLKIIKREVDRFGGTLDINSSIDTDMLMNTDIFNNSIVNISIKIPIKGEITYEHFINR